LISHPSMALVTNFQMVLTVFTSMTQLNWSRTLIYSTLTTSSAARNHQTMKARKIWNLAIKVSKNWFHTTTSSTTPSQSTRRLSCFSTSKATWMVTPSLDQLTLPLTSQTPLNALQVTGLSATSRNGKEPVKLSWLVTATKSSRWFSKTPQSLSCAVETGRSLLSMPRQLQ
jgi:hypothetical protein